MGWNRKTAGFFVAAAIPVIILKIQIKDRGGVPFKSRRMPFYEAINGNPGR